MDQKKLKEKIAELEKELEEFQLEKQKEIDKFMLETGLMQFVNSVNIQVSKMQGKLETLKEFLEDKKEEG